MVRMLISDVSINLKKMFHGTSPLTPTHPRMLLMVL